MKKAPQIFETKKTKPKKSLPYGFVLDLLGETVTFVRPMFGCHALYVNEKIVLILREKTDYADDNGVWIATTPEHHASLKKDFPNMRSIRLFGGKETAWQVLPSRAKDFEESVTRACEFILKGDKRIGKVPQPRKSKRKASRKLKTKSKKPYSSSE